MTSNRNHAWRVVPLLLGLAMPMAHAQQAASPPPASTAVTQPAPAAPKRSAFGEAMARLTGALRKASKESGPALPPAAAAADEPTPPSATGSAGATAEVADTVLASQAPARRP